MILASCAFCIPTWDQVYKMCIYVAHQGRHIIMHMKRNAVSAFGIFVHREHESTTGVTAGAWHVGKGRGRVDGWSRVDG